MKKYKTLLLLLLVSFSLLAQYPRNKVVLEEGTGTW